MVHLREGSGPGHLLPATFRLSALSNDCSAICLRNAFFSKRGGAAFFQPAGFVRLRWSQSKVSLAEIQMLYEQTLSLLVTTGTHKILSVHGQRAPLSGAAQQWITENWIPRALRLPRLSHCAIVEGADPLHRLSTQSVVSASPAGLIFRRFTASVEAEEWLSKLV